VILKDGRIRCLVLVEVDRDVGRRYVASNRWTRTRNGQPESPPSKPLAAQIPRPMVRPGYTLALSVQSLTLVEEQRTTLRDRSVGLSESEREMAQGHDYKSKSLGNSGRMIYPW
jgi:hypothetical protein